MAWQRRIARFLLVSCPGWIVTLWPWLKRFWRIVNDWSNAEFLLSKIVPAKPGTTTPPVSVAPTIMTWGDWLFPPQGNRLVMLVGFLWIGCCVLWVFWPRHKLAAPGKSPRHPQLESTSIQDVIVRPQITPLDRHVTRRYEHPNAYPVLPDYLITLIVENNHVTGEFIVNVVEVLGVIERLPCPWKIKWRDQPQEADRFHITKGDQGVIQLSECSAMGDGLEAGGGESWRPCRIRLFGLGNAVHVAHAANVDIPAGARGFAAQEIAVKIRIFIVETGEFMFKLVNITFDDTGQPEVLVTEAAFGANRAREQIIRELQRASTGLSAPPGLRGEIVQFILRGEELSDGPVSVADLVVWRDAVRDRLRSISASDAARFMSVEDASLPGNQLQAYLNRLRDILRRRSDEETYPTNDGPMTRRRLDAKADFERARLFAANSGLREWWTG